MRAALPENGGPEKMAELPIATEAVELMRLLVSADTFPRGGLYNGFYCLSGALRYELIWLKVLRDHGTASDPPLDVALVWFVHRQFPVSYANCMRRRCYKLVHPPGDRAFAFSGRCSEQWKSVAAHMPSWPPPAHGSEHDLVQANNSNGTLRPSMASQLSESMFRFSRLLHSWLRPHFLDEDFLEQARHRYGRFLKLHAEHPGLTLVPAADIALMWHTHLGLSGRYMAACEALFGPEVLPWRPKYLELEGAALREAYGETARLYQELYGEPYDSSETAWVEPFERYPLAALASPLAFALRAFEDSPSDDEHQVAMLAVQRLASPRGVTPHRLSPSKPATPRAGAHALFAAWLASTTAGTFFDSQTCRGVCFRRSWSIQVATIESMVTPLVLVSYMKNLPDSSKHPFLMAITRQRRGEERGGAWKPNPISESGGQEEEAQSDCAPPTCQQPAAASPKEQATPLEAPGSADGKADGRAAMYWGAGFSLRDPEAFLNDPAMLGLTALLEASEAAAAHGEETGSRGSSGRDAASASSSSDKLPAAGCGRYGDAPLWGILSCPRYAKRAHTLFKHVWGEVGRQGVEHFQGQPPED